VAQKSKLLPKKSPIRLDLFVKLKYQSGTIKSIVNKYSVCDLLSDFIYINSQSSDDASHTVNDVSAPTSISSP